MKMLAALLLSLALCASAVPIQDFDVEKMAGKWYLVGFASDAAWFVGKKSEMKMGTVIMTPTAEGNLNFSLASATTTGCWSASHAAKKTETPGRFVYTSQVWQDENDMSIVEAVFDSFALVHTVKTKPTGIQTVNNLYTRSPEHNAELQAKFRQYSLSTGVDPANIVFLEMADMECSHE
ncbi:lipocalin-like [Nelusetta ayraudi]|uniref:lipocalin-like n=1 Tax=Nelusetta ayraudi TaxID=303726 RepID=UPI003F71D1A5